MCLCKRVLFLCGLVTAVYSQEPGNWPSCQEGKVRSPSMTDTSTRVGELRNKMIENGLQAYIVPSADFHMSEFVSSYDQRRCYMSGFSGSSGTAVITENKVALWTDGRYFLQAAAELGCEWILMREGEQGVPGLPEWVSKEVGSGNKVGACPFYFSSDLWMKYAYVISSNGARLTPIVKDLVDQIWTSMDREFPSTPINALPLKYSGKTWQDKLTDVLSTMDKQNADILVLTGLDEIAWMFNARATDISGVIFDPFFYSFAIIKKDENPKLYIVDKNVKLKQQPTDPATNITLSEHLNTGEDGLCTGQSKPCVEVYEYNTDVFLDEVTLMSKRLTVKKVWVSFHCNYAMYSSIPSEKRYVDNTPAAIMKAKKNDVEVQGMTSCHIRDGAAVARFMAKLERTLKAGNNWTELSASKELSKFRMMQEGNRGDSFTAISSIGPNAAINHYFVTETTDRPITLDETYLLDSGGQYLDGTTDITRTFYFSDPDDYLKECYTRVLMGHIDLAQMVWDKGRYGRELDAFARAPLWDVGLVYRHGTGHGIGAYLSVHEGPGRISNHHPLFVWDVPLEEHMFFSDEPGYYESGKFGIRLENIIYVKQVVTKYKFPGTTMLGMETITLFPYEPHLIDYNLLTDKQITWLNNYNKEIRKKVVPLLKEQGDMEAVDWVMKRTEHLHRHADVNRAAHENYIPSVILILLCNILSYASW